MIDDSARGLGKKHKQRIYLAVVAAHVLVLSLLFLKLPSFTKPIQAQYADKIDVVKATTIDESQIQQYKDKLKEKQRLKNEQARKERERLEKLQREAEQEKKKLARQKKQEALAEKLRQEEEIKRKAIALKKKKEEEKRKKELAEKKRQQEIEQKKAKKKREQEEKARKERERIKREQAELKAIQRQQELAALLAEEERQRAEQKRQQRAATLLGKYAGLITETVRLNLTIAPDFTRDLTAKVNVKLSSNGEVLSVRTLKSSGNIRYDKAINTALYQSSPLPVPSQEEREKYGVDDFSNFNLNFDMKDL